MSAEPLVALADDDVVQAELVSGWLRSLGYAVLTFPDGDALVAWARETPRGEAPAAVLLDVEMPGSDGFSVCRSLRGLATFAAVRVACVSALEPEALERSARAAGADASLRKDAELLPRLAAWLHAA